MGQITARALLQSAVRRLTEAGIADAAFDAMQLFSRHTGITRSQLLADGDRPIDPAVAQALLADVDRRSGGEPLQYLLGEWEFFSLPFAVGPGVLIPRADTEVLVEEALRLLQGVSSPRVVDLCAGSGCVGISIAHARPDARVVCVEKSPEAAAYLRQNIRKNGVGNVTLQMADVRSGPQDLPDADLLVANPPYIPCAVLSTLSAEVRREPALALDGGADGLTFYRAIAAAWLPLVKNGGAVALEVGVGQAAAVADLLTGAALQVRVIPDLNGIERVVTGIKNGNH